MTPEQRDAAREAITEERSGAGTLQAELLANGLELALGALDAADDANERLREELRVAANTIEAAADKHASYGEWSREMRAKAERIRLALYDRAPG